MVHLFSRWGCGEILIEGCLQDFFDPFYRNDGELVAHFLRDLFQILLVGLR